jgi:hypothetical protein
MEVQKTTLTQLDIAPGLDCLIIFRSSDDGPWDEAKEESACKSHDGVYAFLASCVDNKKEVYKLIKSLKVEEPS